jgi:hypothetical protein
MFRDVRFVYMNLAIIFVKYTSSMEEFRIITYVERRRYIPERH